MTRPRRLRLAVLAGGVLAAAVGVTPAYAAGGRAASPGQVAAATGQVSIVITSVTPNIARPGAKVVVSGVIGNPTGAALPGSLTVQLWSSDFPLASQAAMTTYLDTSGTGMDRQVNGVQLTLASPLPARAVQHWSLTLPVSAVGMKSFGVYPLAAQLAQDGAPLAAVRTFLPYWPGGSRARQIPKMKLAWVWPLIDAPQRLACVNVLLSDQLAASVAPGGRLERLLAAGVSPDGQNAQLTWAVDPALVSDVSVMTKPYRVGGGPACSGVSHPADKSASAWLDQVRSAVSHQDFFVTPYDDPDVAALSHAGLETLLYRTFTDGRASARALHLGQGQRPAASDGAGWIAWPPDGVADYGVLENLAADQVTTVVLNSGMMPPAGGATSVPSAVTTTPNGLGGTLRVLLANDTLTKIASLPAGALPGVASSLTSGPPIRASAVRSSPSLSQASEFAQEQWFLAETAMLAAQTPSTARSVVIAPNRRWDPSPAIADALLKDSNSAPWLQPASLAGLASAPQPRHAARLRQPPLHQVSRSELGKPLLRQLRKRSQLVRLQGSVLSPPEPGYLDKALAAVESSAWRGGAAGQRQALSLLGQVTEYVSGQMSQVQIVPSVRVVLGGKSGPVPVSIRNKLNRPVTVGLQVSVPVADRNQVKIGSFGSNGLVPVAAGAQRTIKVPVQVSAPGSITLTLQLTAPNGQPLPGASATTTVEATQFGTLAVVIIGAALLVFVVTAAGRAFRRGGRPATAAGPDDEPEGEPLDPADPDTQTDIVEAERTYDAHSSQGSDDHASTSGRPGRSGSARRG